MRVLELVREEYMKRGVDVYGAYLSPVHNEYGKKGLICGDHRLAMCNAAAEDSGMACALTDRGSMYVYSLTHTC